MLVFITLIAVQTNFLLEVEELPVHGLFVVYIFGVLGTILDDAMVAAFLVRRQSFELLIHCQSVCQLLGLVDRFCGHCGVHVYLNIVDLLRRVQHVFAILGDVG